MWVYNDKLQIKFRFRSGAKMFGQVMALGNDYEYTLSYRISNHSEIKWSQLNIWPNFKAKRL
jgi:hypothetical protein